MHSAEVERKLDIKPGPELTSVLQSQGKTSEKIDHCMESRLNPRNDNIHLLHIFLYVSIYNTGKNNYNSVP
jgi:hypothetical protein